MRRDELSQRGSDVRRVALFRALALGDLLCAVPTLRALRQTWPAAEITLVGLPWAREFAAIFQRYVDRFIEFPGWPGLPERAPHVERIPGFLARMQREQFDLAIQLHGSGTIVNSLVALFGARRTAGFYPPRYFCPDAKTFLPWPEQGLEIHRLLALAEHLGFETHGDELEWPEVENGGQRLRAILGRDLESLGPFVVIHPGASVPERRWSAENFAAVADWLAPGGYTIVLSGVAGERLLAKRVAEAMSHPVIDICGRTDLAALGALVSQASLLVANDTGISHVAAATRTPSVVISTGDNPLRWAPLDRALHRVLCDSRGVSAEEVCQASRAVLDSAPQHEYAIS